MKRLTVFIVTAVMMTVLFAPLTANAQEEVFDDVYGMIPESVKDTLDNAGVDSLGELISLLQTEGVGVIFDIISDRFKAPFEIIISVITVCLFGTVMNLFIEREDIKKVADIIFSLVICVSILVPIKDILLSTAECISSCGVFLFAFLPVFSAFLTFSGQATASVTYTSSIYLFTQFYMFVAKNMLIPISVSYFAFSLSSTVSDNIFKNLLSSVKKGAIWCVSLITTLFTALTSIQSVVASATDSVAIRTGKFIFGTSIPVVGGYVSEVLNTVIGGMSVMRSGLGLCAIIVILVLTVPVLLRILFWKIAIRLCILIVSTDENGHGISIIEAFGDVLTILLAVVICVLIGMMLSLSALLVFGGVK